jgi:5'-nucleotidase
MRTIVRPSPRRVAPRRRHRDRVPAGPPAVDPAPRDGDPPAEEERIVGLSRALPRPSRRVATALASTALIASALSAGVVGVSAAQPPAVPPGSVDIQLLAVNDFHGQLPAGTGSSGYRIYGVDAGGIEYVGTWVRQLEATNPNTLFLSGGDLIGASPLVSALFHDEPTVEAMNLLGMDYAVVGNHEFDEGVAELMRIQDGGCNAVDGCQTGHTYAGADFQYLAANVLGPNGKPIFPAYKIRSFAGAKIGIIGVVTQTTPTIVTPSGVAGLTFLPETETVNRYAEELQAKGVNTIVVLLHEGNPTSASQTQGVSGCPTIASGFYDMVNGMDPAVRVVISGHSHAWYSCTIGNKTVTSAGSAGRIVTDIDLTIERASDTATAVTATNHVVTRDVSPDPAEAALLAYYNALVAPLANAVIGSITANITRGSNAAGESALGDVICDAQLEATAPAGVGGAQIAFTNPGGIRNDLMYAQISGGEQPGQVTYAEAFAVQPFSNILQTFDMTGQQIKDVLEQQGFTTKMLQVSAGFTYSFSASAPTGSKISAMMLDGVPISMAGTYRVTANNFLASGGDGFTAFVNGTPRTGAGIDLDAFIAYFGANSPVAPGPQNRVTKLP